MPTKLNRAGNQQNYVPAGNGDASGEYGDNASGGNIHFAVKKDNAVQNLVLKKNGYEPNDMSEKQKADAFAQLGGENNWANKAFDANSEELQSVDYTRNFVEDEVIQGYYGERKFDATVKITKGSLTKEEIGVLNAQLKEIFERYPAMKKFNTITVRNNASSGTGGYICTRSTAMGNTKWYELYINAGWLDKTKNESDHANNIKFYESQVAHYENQLDELERNGGATQNIEYLKNMIKISQTALDNIKAKSDKYNVIYKISGRKERLKALMAHELMHRITDEYAVGELKDEVKAVYNKALINGDAEKISIYAKTNFNEFLSEANAQIESGIDTPSYIVDIVNKVKGVK